VPSLTFVNDNASNVKQQKGAWIGVAFISPTKNTGHRSIDAQRSAKETGDNCIMDEC
jgi:hypothetical protein